MQNKVMAAHACVEESSTIAAEGSTHAAVDKDSLEVVLILMASCTIKGTSIGEMDGETKS